MQILKEAPECYIQQCENCGAVLKYSECDIHVRNKPFKAYEDQENENNGFCICTYDSFVCPSCSYINEAKRRWLME